MNVRVAIALFAAMAAGCDVLGLDGTLRSARYPGIAIRCEGGAPVRGDVCVTWAEAFLAGIPGMEAKANRIVISFRGGDDQRECSVAFYEGDRGAVVTISSECPLP